MTGTGWAIFTTTAALWFAAGELWAYFGHHDEAYYTTSLRRWLGVNPHRWWVQVSFPLLVGLFAWLLYHLYAVTS